MITADLLTTVLGKIIHKRSQRERNIWELGTLAPFAPSLLVGYYTV